MIACFAAYTLEEIDQKTKSLRASNKYSVDDDATSLDVRSDILFCLAFSSMLIHKIIAILK